MVSNYNQKKKKLKENKRDDRLTITPLYEIVGSLLWLWRSALYSSDDLMTLGGLGEKNRRSSRLPATGFELQDVLSSAN